MKQQQQGLVLVQGSVPLSRSESLKQWELGLAWLLQLRLEISLRYELPNLKELLPEANPMTAICSKEICFKS